MSKKKILANGLKTKVFSDEQLIKVAFLLALTLKKGMKVKKKLVIYEACVSDAVHYQFCDVSFTNGIEVLIHFVTDDLFTFVVEKKIIDETITRSVGVSAISLFDLDNLKVGDLFLRSVNKVKHVGGERR